MRFNHLLFFLFFIFTGCFHWGPRATHLLPEQTALDKSYSYDGKVIIVGAGASGLSAARILEENNIDYLILEATDHYGGRLQEDTEFADFPVDLGAEWIHNNAEILDVLSGQKGTAANMELVPYHLEEVYEWDGKNYEQISPKLLNATYNYFPEYKFKNTTWHSFIREHFADKVAHNIQYNSPVTKIDYSGKKVLLQTQDGSSFTADKVLVTVSIGVLKAKDIQFVPDLGEEKHEVIESIDFYPGMKIFMKFSEKFYPDMISCSGKSGEKTFFDAAFGKEAQDNVLALLVTGDSVRQYGDTEEEILGHMLTELDIIFDGKASETYTGHYLILNWGGQEFTKGTWVETYQLSNSDRRILSEPLDGRVYFAGEALDFYHQLNVPGAVLSGMHAVDQMLTP